MNDIIEAADRANAYVAGLTFERFVADPRTVDAVSFAIVIIGEAARAIPDAVAKATPGVPWADIRAVVSRSDLP